MSCVCTGNVCACHPCFYAFCVKSDPGSTKEIVKECSKTPRLGRSWKESKARANPIKTAAESWSATGGPKSHTNATPTAQSGGRKEATKTGRRARIQVNRAETWDVSGASAAAVPQVAGPPRHKAPNHRRASYELAQARLYLCPEIIPGPSADSGVPPNTNERPRDLNLSG